MPKRSARSPAVLPLDFTFRFVSRAPLLNFRVQFGHLPLEFHLELQFFLELFSSLIEIGGETADLRV